MTLNDALQECARNTYNTKTMVRTGTSYGGKGLEYVNRFISGINYAMNKIAREKVGKRHVETVLLDSQGLFSVNDLAFPCVRITTVYLFDERVGFFRNNNETVFVSGCAGQEVDVTYESTYTEMTIADLDVELPIDTRYVDGKILCQYADYQFLSEEGTDYDSARAQVWLGLFNDSFSNIVPFNRLSRQVVRYD